MIVAVALALFSVISWLLLRDAPGRTPATESFLGRTWATLRRPVTLQLSLLYAIGFGGFVAFSVYLPTYLTNAYGLERCDAALRTAGFVVVAVASRPIGGALSDRVGPVPVLVVCFTAASALALLAAHRCPARRGRRTRTTGGTHSPACTSPAARSLSNSHRFARRCAR